jgi:arsenite methyltransferase
MAMSIALPRALSGEEVARLDPYAFFAVLGKRVIHPGGRSATEQLIDRAEFAPGQQVLDVGCGVATSWVRLYSSAGLTDVQVETGPFDMMTPKGFLHDEGLSNGLAVMIRALSRRCYLSKMDWVAPRIARAVPYLGFILVNGAKARA